MGRDGPVKGFSPVTTRPPKRLSETVFERLSAWIVEGELAPGQVLKDDEIAVRLGVSRMPVREAFLRLERTGMIEMVASRYTRVTELTPELVADAFEYAGHQAGWAARLAARRMTDEELATALALLDDTLAAESAVEEQRRHADAFYLFLVDRARSPHLLLATRDVSLALARALRSVDRVPDDVRARMDDGYRRLRTALAARDADGVERIVREVHGVYTSG